MIATLLRTTCHSTGRLSPFVATHSELTGEYVVLRSKDESGRGSAQVAQARNGLAEPRWNPAPRIRHRGATPKGSALDSP